MKKLSLFALLFLGGMVINSYAMDDADERWAELPEYKRRTRQQQSEAAKRRNQRRLDTVRTETRRRYGYDMIRTDSARPSARARRY